MADVRSGMADDASGESRSDIETVIGISMPHREAVLSTVQPGRLARIAAAEGEIIRENELVFALEDDGQYARVQMARAVSESTLDMDLANTRWERAKRNVERLIKLYGDDSASSKELSDAVAEAEITRIEYEIARFAHAQATWAYHREQTVLDQLHPRAPFTAYVAEHLKEVGETVNENEGVVRLAQLDPLQVAVDCPIPLAPCVHVGDQFRIRPIDAHWPARLGTVIFANHVADAASQTFRVKLTVPNEDARWMSGLKVAVEIPRGIPSEGTLAPGALSTEPRAR